MASVIEKGGLKILPFKPARNRGHRRHDHLDTTDAHRAANGFRSENRHRNPNADGDDDLLLFADDTRVAGAAGSEDIVFPFLPRARAVKEID